MAQDYKNARSSERRGGNRRRRGSKAAGANPRTPGWVWLLTGLSVGLLVALGVYLYNRSHEAQLLKHAAQEKAATETKSNSTTNKSDAKAKSKGAPAKDDEPRFDFYTLLPKQEVVIPEKELREEQQRLAPKENVIYSLQVASFRRYEDADALKARLALLGVEASIQAVPGKEETWQRVMVGPFNTSRDANRVRNHLERNDISALLIKTQKK